MSVRGVDIKVGDKIKYLGNDPDESGALLSGVIYKVIETWRDGEFVISLPNGVRWIISGRNEHCFELVKDDKKDILTLITNLAVKVAQLERELDDLRDASQAQAYEIADRLDELGERGRKQKLVRKEVYIYDED